MNVTPSWPHLVAASCCVSAFAIWHWLAPLPFGARDDGNLPFLLATGWAATFAYVLLWLYAARRAAHRLRWLNPEFRWRVGHSSLQRAKSQLVELENQITSRGIPASKIRRQVRRILHANGAHRVLRVRIATAPRGHTHLSVEPRQVLGRLAAWLTAHFWWGLAAAVLLYFHGGFRSSSPMGLYLNAFSCLVIATGILGMFLWSIGPRLLTKAEKEMSLEKVFVLCKHFERKLKEAESLPAGRVAKTQEISEAQHRLAVATPPEPREALQRDIKKLQRELKSIDEALMARPTEYPILRGQQQRVLREADRLARYRLLLRGWRIVHVPCSIVLFALVVVHVVSILYY